MAKGFPLHDTGASFSLHRCSELGLDKKAVLTDALKDLGLRRFRLMSYWNIHEQKRGTYDFKELDWQLDLIAEHGGIVTMGLGKRQPRWPECHMPEWALKLPKEEWYQALYDFISVVVNRYKDHPALASWQLENEALLKSFGDCKDGDYSRARLKHERELVRQLDAAHPLTMTFSDSWGIPWLGPRPDSYAMSMYRITANKQKRIVRSRRPAFFYRVRSWLVRLYAWRPVFIHELQGEPWTLKAITEVPINEQLETMDAAQLKDNVAFARRTGLWPIDLWGLEWWYWLRQQGNDSLWQAAKEAIGSSTDSKDS